jgi:DNA repair protein RadC
MHSPMRRPRRAPSPARDAALAAGDGPRERLDVHGAEALSEAELIALLLRTGGGGRDALELAAWLLQQHQGLAGLASTEPTELACTPGIGPAKSATLTAALELGRRLAARRLRPGDPVRGPADVFRHFHARLRHARHERFLVVLLDGRHRMMREVVISQGTLTASLVHPREVFRPALREAAAAVVLVHNHPSGDPTPSTEDREITVRLADAGSLLGIPVLDHVVVAERGWASLCDLGVLPRRSAADSLSVSSKAGASDGR